ncbi:septation protein SepH [Kribbella sp. HUAS MG21]|uniref:Septation protein SepH n=1 Tax=Kribbella sp. HUAS MG21 TaxID=3160966 RepID=A0AAU7T967_9ACTN
MREARLVGLSQDGRQLVLAMAETGEEFAVPVDDRLRAALRGDRARLGQLEIQMESALRPRDIQARIRAGESPEAVAAVAQMPMERVMAFAGPVLAERDHIASLAQRASVRRRGGGDAPTRNLGAWVTDRLRTRQVDPASAEWDAWRREDGRWAVRVSYFVESEDEAEQKDEKIAMFAYDAPGRYAVPDDDEARWLVGEQAQVMPTPVQPQPGERRLAAVADIDPLIAPDHGADSYEAGFEDTVALRRRNHPSARESGEPYPREAREPGFARDSGREFGRETGRDPERGPRRVHSVPNPDEEPTLIDVPVDQPPAPRPAVRAVERPADPPAFASPATPHDRTSHDRDQDDRRRDDRASQARGLEARGLDDRPADDEPRPTPAARVEQPRPAPAARAEQARRPQARPADRSTEAGPQEAKRTEPVSPEAPPRAEPEAATAQQTLPDAENAQPAEDTPAEPKKKPARRGKRASVPSWDEIMFGKKAD